MTTMALEFFSRSKHESAAEQAAEWLVEFEDGPLSDAQRRAFVAWLKRSPVHIEEFLELSAIHAQLGSAPALQDSLDDILAEVEGTVVEFAAREQQAEQVAPRLRKRRRFAIAASVLLLVGGALVGSAMLFGDGTRTYRTSFGEQRSIPLADGTVLTLNTASEVRVRLGDTLRSAELIAGEVMFDVAKDPARPFTVVAGPMDIRVVGTRFNVYRQDERTTLTVLEGKVDVAPLAVPQESRPEPKRRVEAGAQLVVATSGVVVEPPMVNIERTAAWTARRVIFDNEPLSGVLAEFNRYNSRRLRVSDSVLAQRKVSGVFKVHDIDVLIAFLDQQHDIRIVRQGDELLIAPAH